MLVFCDATLHPGLPWWWKLAHRWFAPGFGHVSGMIWTGSEWIGLDANSFGLDFEPISDNAWLPLGLAALPEVGAVLEVRRWRPHRHYSRGLTTCVSLWKMRLSVRAWWVISPLALYRWLRREATAWQVGEEE